MFSTMLRQKQQTFIAFLKKSLLDLSNWFSNINCFQDKIKYFIQQQQQYFGQLLSVTLQTFTSQQYENINVCKIVILILNWIYYLFTNFMKGQNSNRILPIKSLLQNLKQQSKKQYLQLDNKNQSVHLAQNSITPRIVHQTSIPLTQRQHPSQDSSQAYTPKDHHKGISLNKHSTKNVNNHGVRQSTPVAQFIYPSFHHSKKEKAHVETSARFAALNQELFKMESQSDHYYNNNKINKSEQTLYPHFKNQAKDLSKNPQNRLSQEFDKDSFTLTDKMNSKFEEQTRYFSKMQSQPIFKDQLTKIKTQLFQKQALLFEKTQELEEKDKIIIALQRKLEIIDSGKGKEKAGNKQKDIVETMQNLRRLNDEKEKRLQQNIEKMKIFQQRIQKQLEQNQYLKSQLDRITEEYSRYEEDNSNSFMLYSLKIRQYEAEQRQRTHQIHQIKEKEKKTIQHQEKIIKGLNQLLRQKEDIISSLTSKSLSYEQLIQNNKQKNQGAESQIQHNEIFIRELSAEVGDLKSSLRNMELRIRQMIEEQQQLKKILQEKSQQNLKLLQQIDFHQANAKHLIFQKDSLVVSHLLAQQSVQKSKKQISFLKDRIIIVQEQKKQLKQSKEQLQNELKQINKKLNESKSLWQIKEAFQQANNTDLKKKIGELNEIIFKRQNSLIASKEKIVELEQKLKKANAPARNSPPKINTTKLIKDNQKLNVIVKDFDSRLYQSLKLNQSLNQQIMKREFLILNQTLCRSFQKDIE